MKIPWFQIEPDKETKLRLLRMESILTAHTLQLTNITIKENRIMADIANLSADLDEIKAAILAKIADLSAQIAALNTQVSNMIPVTQADLDALDAKTEELKALLAPPNPELPPV